MLAGLSVLEDTGGPAAVLLYLVIYLFMNLGAFLVLVALENTFGGSDLRQLRGAVRREPLLCVMLCVFLFSLTGLPPLGGFIGKYLIMWRLADAGRYGMIFWIGLNSVVSLYYYMRLAKAVVMDQPDEPLPAAEPAPVSYRLLAVCKGAALLALFFWFEPVQRLCLQVLETLR
jgi:NADH-quinone oxidoreductase subunit N